MSTYDFFPETMISFDPIDFEDWFIMILRNELKGKFSAIKPSAFISFDVYTDDTFKGKILCEDDKEIFISGKLHFWNHSKAQKIEPRTGNLLIKMTPSMDIKELEIL